MHLIKLILAAACLGQALSSGIRQPAGTEDKTPSRADQERSAHRLQKRVEPVNHKTMQFLVDMAFSLMDKGIPTFCEALCFASKTYFQHLASPSTAKLVMMECEDTCNNPSSGSGTGLMRIEQMPEVQLRLKQREVRMREEGFFNNKPSGRRQLGLPRAFALDPKAPAAAAWAAVAGGAGILAHKVMNVAPSLY